MRIGPKEVQVPVKPPKQKCTLGRKTRGGSNEEPAGEHIIAVISSSKQLIKTMPMNSSKLSSIGRQMGPRDQLARLNPIAADDCATRILEAAAVNAVPKVEGAVDEGGPEAAAAAMMSAVRLILMILICVLLVKLRSPKSVQLFRARRRISKNSNKEDGDNSSNYKDNDGQRSRFFLDAFDYRKILQLNSNNKGTKSDDHDYDMSSRLSVENNKSSESSLGKQRRRSQPELVSSGRAQELAAQQRRRRHSDTCVAHLKLPPGPMGLPFLGYLPFVGHEIHLTLTSLSERYGPIYQIFLGGIRVVVLNDAGLVRQAFKQPVFSGRPDTQLTRILQGYGIVNSDGALWKEQRAFLHSALRKLGAKSLMGGSNGLQAKIQNQVREFVNDLSGHAASGRACQVRPIVARAVSSVVGSIVMNLTYRKYEEKEKFDRLIELMQEGFRLFTIAMPLDFIPIFRFLPGVSYAYKKMKRNRAETSAFFQGVADEHRKYLDETFNLNEKRAACGSEAAVSSRSSESTSDTTSCTNSPLHPRSFGQPQELMATTGAGCGSADRQQQAAAAAAAAQLPQLPLAQQSPHKPQCVHFKQDNSRQLDKAPLLGAEASCCCDSAAPTSSRMEKQASGGNQIAEGNEQEKEQHVELENIVARDLVDAYLVQQRKHEKDGKENYFSDQQLVQIMSDIFSAGLETVTSTIEWSILFLMLNTKCQDRIQVEIDRVIGRQRMPQLDDLSQMPYTEATIYEVLRRSNVIALGNAHATLDDASIGGYLIPKGTQVLPNLYGIHMNPKLWDEPDKFEPSRFIVNEKAQKPDYFIPFSVGRRMCLGDVLAKMEVFLFLVGLLQKYDLSVAEEDRHCPPQIKGTIGVSNTPASFRVALHCRDNNNGQEDATTTMTLGGLKREQSVASSST